MSKKASVVIRLVQSSSTLTQKISRKAAGKKRVTCFEWAIALHGMYEFFFNNIYGYKYRNIQFI